MYFLEFSIALLVSVRYFLCVCVCLCVSVSVCSVPKRCFAARVYHVARAAGCLDYIFLSPGVRAVSAEPLLSLEELSPGGPLPTAAAEPSDHVMLAACIEIEVPDSG
jgi:hypothetical protein